MSFSNMLEGEIEIFNLIYLSHILCDIQWQEH